MSPRILFLVPDNYDELDRKGVAQMIWQRDEHGFFERVVTVHPLAGRSRVLDLNPVHRIVEYDLGRGLKSGSSWWSRFTVPARALALVPRLVRLVRRERISLIRATDPYLMGLLGWAVSRLTRRPLCVSIHVDYDKNFALTPRHGWGAWLRRAAAWCPRFVFPRADLVLPIRDHLANWALRHQAPSDRIRIIRHGIDLTGYATPIHVEAVRTRYGIEGYAPIVTFVGRLSRYNYVHDVLAAAEQVLLLRPNVVFLLFGDGEERAALEEAAAAKPLTRRGVRVLGFRAAEEVREVRMVSAVSLCPMAGFSLIEACASGSPVIAYDVDWHREIITDGITGLLVREGDVDGLASAVLRVLDDRDLAARLGAAARQFVLDHHDEPRTSEVKRACYAALMGAPLNAQGVAE